jgi:dipeptidyl aminopeptidase/acylaminoacyl peptidase
MRRSITIIAAAILHAYAQPRNDGDILSSKPWPTLPTFDSLDDFSRNYFPKTIYDEARTQKVFDILDITYASDGLAVRGFLVRPKDPGVRKWPAIIFNRGGTGDYGRISLTTEDASSCREEHTPCLTMVDSYLWAKEGFVVIGSDYRFHESTAKQDQWGGVDVNDVINLVPALSSLSFVDMDHVYMLGESRGGTMTYIALKRRIPVKAAAVIAGPSDLEAGGRNRPDLVNGDDSYDGWAKVWPDYEHRADEYYHERSAVFWADQINVPVLILHIRIDRLVPVTHALRMAAAMQAAGANYALHIYSRDGHSLPANRADRNRQIVEWFRQAK